MHLLKSKLQEQLYATSSISEFARVTLAFVAKQVGAYHAAFYANMSHDDVNWVMTAALPDTKRFTECFPFGSLVSSKTIERNTFVIDSSENLLSFAFTPLFAREKHNLDDKNDVMENSNSLHPMGLMIFGITITQEEKRKKIEILNEVSGVISVQLRLVQLEVSSIQYFVHELVALLYSSVTF
jgi:hypothetical protein